MKFNNSRFRFVAGWIALLSLAFQAQAWADDDEIERIFIFGDSLSDPGNVHVLSSGLTAQPPYDIIPGAPYDFKGFQFSNGKTWAQKFARLLELKKSGKAALSKPRRFTNYAFGGARARVGAGVTPSGPEQILNFYLPDFPGAADDEALYVIQFGGNDVRDALEAASAAEDPDAGFVDAQAIVARAVESEIGMIVLLYGLGAREFLVATVPNLALTPAIRLQDIFTPGAAFATSQLVGGYNAALEGALRQLEQSPAFTGISIKRLDFFRILNDINANPGSFGINEVESACLSFGVIVDPVCDKPGKYLFWDGIYPTKKVHRIVAEQAARLYDD